MIGRIARHRRTGSPVVLATLLGLGVLLALRALFTPPDHDESQYVAGAALAAEYVIFRDFMHLQTPLQALLFSPLPSIFPGQAFLAMRLANALLATLVLFIQFATIRSLGASRLAALAGAALLALSQPYQLSAVLVRNDILPAAFSALATWAGVAAVQAERRPVLLWFLSGLAFGLAVSTKISHAFLAAAAGAFVLGRVVGAADRGARFADLLAFAVGGLLGLVPSLVFLALAPEAFAWGVVEYGATAPFDWYRANGLEHTLELRGKVAAMLDAIGRSPIIPALVVIPLLFVVGRREGRADLVLLDVLLVGGLIAALLPTPTWPYYFVTLVPVLFVRLAAEFDRLRQVRWPLRALALVVLAGSSVLMINWEFRNFLTTPPSNYAVPGVEAEAHWIGKQLRGARASGRIATLSPHLVIDSGYPIDRRFAAGVFVYRSGHLLDAARHERFETVGPQTIGNWLDRSQPAAIVVGDETRSSRFRIHPDDRLRAYALSRGYRLEKSRLGPLELYINPRRIQSPRPTG